jgi:hypothetical protein
MTAEIAESFMSAENARTAAFERERARQWQRIDWAKLEGEERRKAMEGFYNWEAAARRKMEAENDNALTKMLKDWTMLGQGIQQAMVGAVSSFVDSIGEADFNFGKFILGIIKQLLKMIVVAMIAYAILSAMGMANNAAGEKVGFGDYMKNQLSVGLGGRSNDGMNIGFGKQGATPPITPPKKYHTGGWLGAKPLGVNEVPFIGKRGELILTEDQQGALGRRLAGAGTPSVTLNIINNSGVDLDAEQGDPHFDAAGMIIDVVVEAAGRDGRLRNALSGIN